MSQERVEAFRRLMESQQRIADALIPQGVSDALLETALAAAEPALPRDAHDQRDFYLPALELYAGALGGRLESSSEGLRAVFPGITVGVDHA